MSDNEAVLKEVEYLKSQYEKLDCQHEKLECEYEYLKANPDDKMFEDIEFLKRRLSNVSAEKLSVQRQLEVCREAVARGLLRTNHYRKRRRSRARNSGGRNNRNFRQSLWQMLAKLSLYVMPRKS